MDPLAIVENRQLSIPPEGQILNHVRYEKKRQFWVHESVATEFKGLLKNYSVYGKNLGCDLWTDQVALCRSSEVELFLPKRYRNLGIHESENILAAWIICHHFGVLPEAFLRGLETFEKPPHRIEKIASIQGVDYVNDSKGTNIDATIKAVESMQKPVILIVGGVDKGASYESWKASFRGKVRHVLALGRAAERISADLKPEYEVEILSSLREVVFRAHVLSERGDVVLLSPGCASFDMFRDYAHRGDEFKKIINELGEVER
jgi:UDP-N-acetylmuramoylalanine--D-glutamate ligase